MATRTRKRSAGLDRILAGKRQEQNDVQRDDLDGSVLSQERVNPARSENHAQDRRRYRWATLRVSAGGGTHTHTQSAERKPSFTDHADFTSLKESARKIRKNKTPSQ